MAQSWSEVVAPVLDAAREALRAVRATGTPRWSGDGARAFSSRRQDAEALVAAAAERAEELRAAAAALDRAIARAEEERASGAGNGAPQGGQGGGVPGLLGGVP